MSDEDDIEGRLGDISGRMGDISGRLGDISGRLGDISGGPFEPVRRMVFEGRLIDELSFLTAKVRRLEKDLLRIMGSLDARLQDVEDRLRKQPPPTQPVRPVVPVVSSGVTKPPGI